MTVNEIIKKHFEENVKEIVKQYLEQNGYTGLVDGLMENPDCSCNFENFMPCGSPHKFRECAYCEPKE